MSFRVPRDNPCVGDGHRPGARAGVSIARRDAASVRLSAAIGNRTMARLAAAPRLMVSRGKAAEGWFALWHPVAAAGIYDPEQSAEVENPSTSSLAVRFSINLDTRHQTDLGQGGLTENPQHAGSEVNAMRHTVWNALNTQRWGADIAREAADAHEDDPHAIDNQDPAKQHFATLLSADQGVDLRNNIIGRDIGGRMAGSATPKEIAAEVLRTFHEQGLWVAEQQSDGSWLAVRRLLTDDAFAAAAAKLARLNAIGLTPAGEARWRAAREAERARLRELYENPPPYARLRD